MEPPAKRQRRSKSNHRDAHNDDDDDDELSFEPLEIRAKRDPAYQLSIERAHADNRFQATMAHIFDKYGRDFEGIGDEIDLMTGEILVDNGHLENMRDEGDVGVSMEDIVQHDDLFSSPEAEPCDEGLGLSACDDDEEDGIMCGGKAASRSSSLIPHQPPKPSDDDLLPFVNGFFGRPPAFGTSHLGFGASPFAMEPWAASDPFSLSPWERPSNLFPTPADRYHFPAQDGGNSIWQPGYRYRDDEPDQPSTPIMFGRIRPDVKMKPMKYMLPSAASRPDDADESEEIDEDAILMGRDFAQFEALNPVPAILTDADELVLSLPQDFPPLKEATLAIDTQTDSTATTDDGPLPKRPRLTGSPPPAKVNDEPPRQRLIIELPMLEPSRRRLYESIDEPFETGPLDNGVDARLHSPPPRKDPAPASATLSLAQGRNGRHSARPDSDVLDVFISNPDFCLSDDEMPIALPQPRRPARSIRQPNILDQQRASPPPAPSNEDVPSIHEQANPPPKKPTPSPIIKKAAPRPRRKKSSTKKAAAARSSQKKSSRPPTDKARRLERELRWLDKTNRDSHPEAFSLSSGRPLRRAAAKVRARKTGAADDDDALDSVLMDGGDKSALAGGEDAFEADTALLEASTAMLSVEEDGHDAEAAPLREAVAEEATEESAMEVDDPNHAAEQNSTVPENSHDTSPPPEEATATNSIEESAMEVEDYSPDAEPTIEAPASLPATEGSTMVVDEYNHAYRHMTICPRVVASLPDGRVVLALHESGPEFGGGVGGDEEYELLVGFAEGEPTGLERRVRGGASLL
ncbi:hypothetical protein CDD80_4171 [Ophiocordyceps camponoti-rufipedis]|uniref:Uncharacterized protein n=1 Tax=Ophiocordyceps camponoti-rufipedis TaxID=2004952 RepID=A0A2C5YTR9_9HYPO|nr:hypothetical protein CDD80_4171 [Ophiocordyceps camponoti-rufipedis]